MSRSLDRRRVITVEFYACHEAFKVFEGFVILFQVGRKCGESPLILNPRSFCCASEAGLEFVGEFIGL